MIEKILLADSGAGQAEAMIKTLMDLPCIQRASVTVLHVVPSQVTTDEMTENWEEGGQNPCDRRPISQPRPQPRLHHAQAGRAQRRRLPGRRRHRR